MGGGILFGSHPAQGGPDVVFSQINRCSIYNNFAEWGMDIHWHYTHGGTLDIYLKKFTVPQWEKYFADYFDYGPHPSPYTVFDIQEAYLEPLDADFYVSPYGDDSNDGLSPASPLKTPAVEEETIPVVAELQLSNYPNPFNPSTTISYSVPTNADIRLDLYNAKGQLVNTLVNEYKEQGKHQIVWSGKDKNGNMVSSGIYFSRVVSGGKSSTRKMLLVK